MKEYIVMEMYIWIDDKTTKIAELKKVNNLIELVEYINKKLDIYYMTDNIMHPIQNIESYSLFDLREGVKKGYYIIYDNSI